MNRATYNITDDRLKAWFDNRLSPEDYAAAKAAGFVWWPGSKCFSCVWRPSAEDFLSRFGLEIEDITDADDVAARVDRFSKYAENAEQAADNAAERLESGVANTERRQRLAEGVAAREFSTAAHWQRRIAGADRVLMNPPFEKRQDEAHMRHAFTFLKPGGRLVAVCSSMTGARLADWVRGRGYVEDLAPDAFRLSERPTGVRTSLVVIDN